MLINNEMGNLTASRSLTLLEAEMEQFAVSLTVCVCHLYYKPGVSVLPISPPHVNTCHCSTQVDSS